MKKALIILLTAILVNCTPKYSKEDFIGNWESENNPNHQVDITAVEGGKYKVSEWIKNDASLNMESNPNYQLINGKLVLSNETITIENKKLIFKNEAFKKK